MPSGPLVGIRVLEFGQIIAAPLACQFLSDLGAEVIKIEPPKGEPWRLNAQYIPLESKPFHELNRGKKSLAIDLSRLEAQEAIHCLARTADVVVINYRPDVAGRMRIDYETLAAIRPDLIYADSTAFGRKGEMADRPGYDIVVQAASGLLSSVGKVDANGTPVITSPAVADTTTAYAIATGVCAALFHRALTGKGQRIETSLLANALALQVGIGLFSSVPAADSDERGDIAARIRDARAKGTPYAEVLNSIDVIRRFLGEGNIYYRCFLTCDGAIAIGALSASLRAKVRDVLGVEHNRDEPGYNPRDPDQRAIDQKIVAAVEDKIRSQPTAYWERTFDQGGVPVSALNFTQELIDHPQVLANDFVIELEHDLSGPQRLAAPPWKMSATPPEPQGASPPLGKHTNEILASAGYGEDEIEALRAKGIIR